MPTRAWGILMDFILLCLLLSYVDFLLSYVLICLHHFMSFHVISCHFMSFHVISCHFSFFLLVVRLRAPLQELGQVHWKFQLVPLTHCGRTLNVFSHLCSTAYWLHVAQRSASWLVGKAPVQGLRSEWELDDDRLQCFNIGEESKKERKGKWERRCKRVLLSDNFFVAFNSYDKVAKVEHKSLWVCIRVLLILRTILSHCLCEARLDAMIPVSLAEMTAQWAPCLTNPRHIFISYHFMALPTFSHQTRWSVQVLCHVVSNGNGCEKSLKKNDAEKQRSNRGVQAVRVSVKLHRSHRWSCSSWRLTGATRHRMSWGLCPRTILTRAAE